MSNRKATREIIARHRAQKLGLRNKKSSKILIKPKEHPKSVSLKKNVPTPKRLIPTQVFRNNFNPQLEQYIKNKSNFNFSIGIHDAGGGGDCLFHSISAGIQQAFSLGLEKKLYSMPELRRQVGDYVLSLKRDKFNELISNYKVIEEYSDWYDNWSPSSIKNPQQLANELSKTGNNHWGTEFDLKALSEKLKIGFIIFSSLNGQIYCFGQELSFKKPNYYMFIYNISNTHYTLSGLKSKNQSSYISVYRPPEIPKFLRNEYQRLCHCSL